MLHDSLSRRGVRDRCQITLVLPFMTPVPPSPDTSAALVGAFAERDIAFVPSTKVKAVDHDRGALLFESGDELPFDLFLGVPKHRAPDGGARQRPGRGRLDPCRPGHARDEGAGRVRHRRCRHPGHAEGRRVRRGRRPGARRHAGRQGPRHRRRRHARGQGLVLHRVRRRPHRPRRRRLPLRALPDRSLPRAVGDDARPARSSSARAAGPAGSAAPPEAPTPRPAAGPPGTAPAADRRSVSRRPGRAAPPTRSAGTRRRGRRAAAGARGRRPRSRSRR